MFASASRRKFSRDFITATANAAAPRSVAARIGRSPRGRTLLSPHPSRPAQPGNWIGHVRAASVRSGGAATRARESLLRWPAVAKVCSMSGTEWPSPSPLIPIALRTAGLTRGPSEGNKARRPCQFARKPAAMYVTTSTERRFCRFSASLPPGMALERMEIPAAGLESLMFDWWQEGTRRQRMSVRGITTDRLSRLDFRGFHS